MRLAADQQAAAALLDGAVRVVAGAGTGKTAVIAERFRRLVKRGTTPSSILVLTFTDRAAREMRTRIESAIGESAPSVGTFHSIAMGWLREHAGAVGLRPNFRILAGADRWIALRELMWELGEAALIGEDRPDDLVTPLLKVMERLKQELVPLGRLEEWCSSHPDEERAPLLGAAARLFREHERRSRAAGVLDFDDILVESIRLLERPAASHLLARYRHVMVDEYQDTNLAQERLVELLGRSAASVFVVGDDDQSIYRFRGAALASMNRFLEVFPQAQAVTLGVNRRSTRSIVEAAAALVANNRTRIAKDIRSERAVGPSVVSASSADVRAEAAGIGGRVVELHSGGIEWSQMAVLCRTHAIARPVVDALRRLGVPHRQAGAGGMYDVPEVRDVIAMLRLLADPNDLISLARCLIRPPVAAPLEAGLAQARSAGERESYLSALARWPPSAAWATEMVELRALSQLAGAEDLFFELMSRTRLLEIHAGDQRAVAAVVRFGEMIGEFCATSRDQSLAAWLARLDLLLLSGYDEEVDAGIEDLGDEVRVMTIHQAKGLEFDAVFVPSLVEGRLPQPVRGSGLDLPPAILEPAVRRREDHVAEERRLMYVALTRARRHAFLTCARIYDGTREWLPSRFLGEMAASGRVRAVTFDGEAEREPRQNVGPASLADADRHPDQAFSFSSLAAYRECPAQHRFRYQLQLPAAETAEGQYGTIVHAALMRLGRRRRDGEAVTPEDAEAAVVDEWSKVCPVDGRRLPALQALSARQVRDFVAGGGLANAPELVEHAFTTTVDGWPLQGIIDRVDRRFPPPSLEGGEVGSTGAGEVGSTGAGEVGSAGAGEVGSAGAGEAGSAGAGEVGSAGAGEVGRTRDAEPAWRIVDYKTGNPLPASRLRRDLQLALYALGASQELGLDPIELEIVYLKTGRRVVVPATDDLLDEARRLAGEAVAGIRAGRFEPRPERRRCSLCPYRLACPAAL